jgi:proteasome lid subunit RPN8/RPN11
MTTTISCTTKFHERILDAARNELETAAVILAHLVIDDLGNMRLMLTEFHPVPPEAYKRREVDSLSISSDGYVPALGRAEEIRAVAIWFHTHPGVGSVPRPSSHDVIVDQQIGELFRLRANSKFYSALIVSPTETGLTFTGYIEDCDGKKSPFDQMQIVGDRLQSSFSYGSRQNFDHDIFDRNTRAFGGGIQEALSKMRIGIVGCGGTGSAVGEQLVRLGVRKFCIADPDTLTASNVTRVYGSTFADVGQNKVQITENNLRRIALDIECQSISSAITNESVARQFATCDIIFGCTDDNAGRLVLSRLSTFFQIPVFDLGVLISTDANGKISGIDGRVTTLVPGTACLLCRGRIDTNRARSELLTDRELQQLVKEGYAPALGGVEPAVVTFTTMVASVAISELLERLVGYGLEPRPSEVLIRYHDREISTNNMMPRPNHYCDLNSGKSGLGETQPFLEIAWTNS